MTINVNNAGNFQPVEKLISALHYMDAEDVTESVMASLKTEGDLQSITGLISGGAISPDGISTSGTESGSSDATILDDMNGNVITTIEDSATASDDQTISFTPLESLTPAVMRLVYKNVAEDGAIDGLDKPDDKLFVLEYLIKGAKVREIFPLCTFQGRGERTLTREELEGINITYSIKEGDHGIFFKRIFR